MAGAVVRAVVGEVAGEAAVQLAGSPGSKPFGGERGVDAEDRLVVVDLRRGVGHVQAADPRERARALRIVVLRRQAHLQRGLVDLVVQVAPPTSARPARAIRSGPCRSGVDHRVAGIVDVRAVLLAVEAALVAAQHAGERADGRFAVDVTLGTTRRSWPGSRTSCWSGSVRAACRPEAGVGRVDVGGVGELREQRRRRSTSPARWRPWPRPSPPSSPGC